MNSRIALCVHFDDTKIRQKICGELNGYPAEELPEARHFHQRCEKFSHLRPLQPYEKVASESTERRDSLGPARPRYSFYFWGQWQICNETAAKKGSRACANCGGTENAQAD
jgi:hypothetical protein